MAKMSKLADRTCIPCKGGVPPLSEDAARSLLAELDEWELVDAHHLRKRWKREDFQTAQALANAFGDVSEAQNHHPVLSYSWGWVEAQIWTHKIDGLTESDFVLAAKFDRVAADGADRAD